MIDQAGQQVSVFEELDDRIVFRRGERTFAAPVASQTLLLGAPPEVPSVERQGLLRMLLPALGSLSVVAYGVASHELLPLVLGLLVVAVTVAATVGVHVGTRRQATARRRRVVEAYRTEVGERAAAAAAQARSQRDGQLGTHPDPADLLQHASRLGALWERRPEHPDFLRVRIGLGSMPANVGLQLAGSGAGTGGGTSTGAEQSRSSSPAAGRRASRSGPEAQAATQALLLALAEDAIRSAAHVRGVPVTLDLRRLPSVAVVGPDPVAVPLVAAWVAELATFHAPRDLTIAGLIHPPARAAWEWGKWLPHVTDHSGADPVAPRLTGSTARFLAVLETLRGIPTTRSVVVLVDERAADDACRHALDALRSDDRSVTAIHLCPSEATVPTVCAARLDLLPDGTCTIRESGPEPRAVTDVVPASLAPAKAEELARWLAPVRLVDDEGDGERAVSIRLTELVSAEASAADAAQRMLSTPLGRDTAGRALELDLKESARGGDGPHGVLVGATGSGKSELLRSIVLGLALRHDPSQLALLLVDFKGGAAFAELAALPHCGGLVTNLADDLSLVDRVEHALTGEVERRQQLLRDCGRASIDELRPGEAELPYLVVVVDEFGELLVARPELLEVLTAIGRLGRSLGIHLLLASQRLDEGRLRGLESHLSYRIGLRTFTPAESTAVLGSSVAYELPARPGLGYLKVAGALTAFQGATSSLPPDSASTGRTAPVRVFALDVEEPAHPDGPTRGGSPAARLVVARGDEQPAADEASTELSTLVAELVARHPRTVTPIWLPPLPAQLSLDDLAEPEQPPPGVLPVAVGLLDDPARRRQPPLLLDPGKDHVALIGGPQTGRTTFLRTVVDALTRRHPAEVVQLYVVDCAGGGLRDLLDLPHVAAVADGADPQSVARVVDELAALVAERTEAFRLARCTDLAGLRAHPDADSLLPDPLRARVLVLVDGAGQLRAQHHEQEQRLVELASTAAPHGVRLAMTAARWFDVRPALLDAIGCRLELRLADPSDSQLGRAAASTVPRIAGRGLTQTGEPFQLARSTMRPVCVGAHTAPRLVALPARLTLSDVPPLLALTRRRTRRSNGFLLGVSEARPAAVHLDLLRPGAHLLILGDHGSGRSTLVRRACAWLAEHGGVRLHMVDPARSLVDVATLPGVESYAYDSTAAGTLAARLADELAGRRPPLGMPVAQLLEHPGWRGASDVLVVDDYDRLLGSEGSPLAPLGPLLGQSSDLGLHVLLTRQVAGSARSAYEPFTQQLRECAPVSLLLSGERSEGPLVGDHYAVPRQPGRGLLVNHGGPPSVVQVCLPDDP